MPLGQLVPAQPPDSKSETDEEEKKMRRRSRPGVRRSLRVFGR